MLFPSDGTFWIALVGALSWLPQIGRWIYSAFTRPKLSLVSAPNVGMTYGNLGPVVLLTSAISVEKRDALVNKITLKATHEKGEVRHLTWQWLDETQSQLRVPTGETVSLSKSQPALALKVATSTLVEKVIFFLDSEFLTKSQALTASLLSHYDYLKGVEDDAVQALFKSKEYLEVQKFFKEFMYWKEGSYEFEIGLHAIKGKSPQTQHFSVTLNRKDVELLRSNIDDLQDYVRALLPKDEQGTGDTIKAPTWKWANPQIIPQ